MDKTTWFVVLACAAGIGLNYWMQDDAAPGAPASTPPPAATAPAQPGAESPALATQPTAAPVHPAARVPQQIATLVGRDKDGKEVARFNFQDVGGSLSSVTMVDKAINSTNPAMQDDVRVNGNAPQGIGTLMFGLSGDRAPSFDAGVYEIWPERTTDTRLSLVSQSGDLRIIKEYTLHPVEREKKPAEENALSDFFVKLFGGEPEKQKHVEGNAYALNLTIAILNTGNQALSASNWGIYAGAVSELPSSSWGSGGYVNYLTLTDGDYDKYGISTFNHWFTRDEARRYDTDLNNLEWGGLMNQYYATVVKPDQASSNNAVYAAPIELKTPVTGEKQPGIELGLGIPDFPLAAQSQPNDRKMLSYDIFVGPKRNLMLNGMTDDFRKIDRVMDYGIFTFISHPMNWLLNVFHGWFGNWGWAIVAMTFVVRLLIWPLYRKSYKSMKSMSLLQPKMQELKEKYPDDQQKVSMEMMKLYREYGISPASGCLPMLLQMPIFLAFFWVLQAAEEFRGAPFIGWVKDLSQMDTICTLPIPGLDWELPINILPVTMVLLMWLQMRMTPQAGDPMQRRMIQLMPLFFFAFCYFYQSALALYWTVTNIISIFQTWLIRRLPEPELKKQDPTKKKGKKGFFERMMEAQQKALAEQQRQANMRNVTPKK